MDLGLAHGLAGAICALASIIRVTDLPGTRNALRRTAESLAKQHRAGATMYPYGTGDAGPSRLGWCYGDMSVGFALSAAGGSLGKR